MKKLFFLILGLLMILYMSSCENAKIYTIELTYCDSSKPKERLRVKSYYTPYIQTYKQAVPVYTTSEKTYINVCDLTILEIENE